MLFLGGPLTFIKGLRKAFVNTLQLSDENAVFPENAQCFMAYGSALYATETDGSDFTAAEIAQKMRAAKMNDDIITGRRLLKIRLSMTSSFPVTASMTCLLRI